MQDPEKIRLPEEKAANVIEFLPDEKDSSRYEAGRLLRLFPAAVYVFVGLAVLAMLAATLDPHRRSLLLGGTTVFLIFAFGFAALIVRSYHRDKEKMMKQKPYRDDHIIQ